MEPEKKRPRTPSYISPSPCASHGPDGLPPSDDALSPFVAAIRVGAPAPGHYLSSVYAGCA